MRSIRRTAALLSLTATLVTPAVLAGSARAADELPISAIAGRAATQPGTLVVSSLPDARLQFQMNGRFFPSADQQVLISPNQAGQRIAPWVGCEALPVTAVPNQGVACDASDVTTVRMTLSSQPDSFFFVLGQQDYNTIDIVADGAGGPDAITSGAGDDDLHGGPGADILRSGSGADLVNGGSGQDTVDTGSGDDEIDVREGLIVGERDTVTCGAGTDRVRVDLSDVVADDCEVVVRR